MARIRTLKPTFFTSRSLSKVSIAARMTFAGLWCHADDTGRGSADPAILKGALWPHDAEVTEEVVLDHLHALAETGHIAHYEVDGDPFFQVARWEKHQASSYRTGKAQHPAPADGTPISRDSTTSREKPRPVVRNHPGEDGSGWDGMGVGLDIGPGISLTAAVDTYKGAARQEDVWAALEHEIGPARTDTERGNRGRTAKELRQARATPQQIHERCIEYRKRWPEMTLTDSALRKHWSLLAEAQVITPRMNTGTAALVKLADEAARRKSAS